MEDPDGDTSKNEERPRSNVNEAQIEVIDLDSPEREGVGPLLNLLGESPVKENPPVPNEEGQSSRGDFSMFEHNAELDSNPSLFGAIVQQILNRVLNKFNPEEVPNQKQVVRNSIHAEGVLRDQNEPLLEAEHIEQNSGKTILKDAKPDSSTDLTLFGHEIGNFIESEHAKNPPVRIYEDAEEKIISDLDMKDAKPDSSIDSRLFGCVIKNLEESEHAKDPPIPMYEHAEGDALNQNKVPIEAEDNDQDPRMTISDVQNKDVKSDPSKRKRVRFDLDNIKESEHGKDRPVPSKEGHCLSEYVSMYEHADGDALDRNKVPIEAEDNDQDPRMTIRDVQIKDVKSDPSRRKRVRFVSDNIKESDHGKDSPVPNKKGHCSSEDVSMYEHAEAEDNDEDLRMTISDIQNKIVKSDSSKRPRVRFIMKNMEESEHGKDSRIPNKEGHCSNGDVPVHEHAAESNLDLAKLDKHTLRRYIKQFEIKGFNHRSSKEKLLKAMQRHFYAHPPLDMQQVIPEFVAAAMKNKA